MGKDPSSTLGQGSNYLILPHFGSKTPLFREKTEERMSKTIIECMFALSEKMKDEDNCAIKITPATTKKAAAELRVLKQVLGMSTMQVLILTAVVQKSARYRIDGEVIASFLGMEYLQFLTYDSDLEYLRKNGYIRMDKDLRIHIPKEVLKALKGNRPVEPEPVSGLSTGKILSRMKKLLSIRSDGELSSMELDEEMIALFENNPDTSVSKAVKKYLEDVYYSERILFYGLVSRYWFEDDDMVGWHNVDDYLEEEELDELRTDSLREDLKLQRDKVIEYTGFNGMMTKDYFKIRDAVKEEVFADVGGIRKEAPKVSASRKLPAGTIGRKDLFYNIPEGRQVEQLKELLSEERFNDIRERMKAKGLRTGFTCLFYGGPGTGKTETVYQIARKSGRNLFIVDVSKIKSCWVGESEKNIKEVFDNYRQTVKAGGMVPILLFNEADAIFGIRQEGAERAVDKMENSIQNIILQEMEDLDGILIATTNLTTNLDKAFERRFLYKIRFEKPSVEAKVSIWRTMIPSLSETEAERLATEFDFSGGQIENIARKKEVRAIIGPDDPDFAEIRMLCAEENIASAQTLRKIGF